MASCCGGEGSNCIEGHKKGSMVGAYGSGLEIEGPRTYLARAGAKGPDLTTEISREFGGACGEVRTCPNWEIHNQGG